MLYIDDIKKPGNEFGVWKSCVLTPDTKGLWNGVTSKRMLSKFFALSCLDFGKLTCQDESRVNRLELAEWVRATGYYEELASAGLVTSKCPAYDQQPCNVGTG